MEEIAAGECIDVTDYFDLEFQSEGNVLVEQSGQVGYFTTTGKRKFVPMYDIRDERGRFLRDEYYAKVSVSGGGTIFISENDEDEDGFDDIDGFKIEGSKGSLSVSVSVNIELRDGSEDFGEEAADLGAFSAGQEASIEEVADMISDLASSYAELVGGSKGVIDMSIESVIICYRV